jgi:hypothetical protein
MTTEKTPMVYAAIAAVMGELASEGISKDRRNKEQGFAFRGIEDVYTALSQKLVRHGLLMLPRAKSHRHEVRQTKSGSNQYVAIMNVEFDMVSVQDGSKHTIETWGEAADTADKSTSKAMSAAYKYAAFQAFCIPVQGHEDADATTPEETVPRETAAQRFLREANEKAQGCATLTDLETTYKREKQAADALLDGDDAKRFNGIFGARKKALTPATTDNPFHEAA